MHSLRGALAVAMIGDGTPMPVVSAVLGHASSDTTQAQTSGSRLAPVVKVDHDGMSW
jgi:site-specific recombinase XerD